MMETAKMAARKAGRRFGLGKADIDDLTQIAAERCFRQRHRFDPTRGDFGAFCSTVARNAIADELRRRGSAKRGGGLPDLPFDDELSPDDHAASQEHVVLGREVRESFAALDPGLCSIGVMLADGIAIARIAQTHGIARGTVYARAATIGAEMRKFGFDGPMRKNERPTGCSRTAVQNTCE